MRRVASTPLEPGICRSISTISGWSATARVMASSPVVASPATSVSGSAARNARIPLRKGDDRRRQGRESSRPSSYSFGSGAGRGRACPLPGTVSTSRLPPSSSARSRMGSNPTPALRSAGKTGPVVDYLQHKDAALSARRTQQVRARAWRTTLVSASCTMRYAATSTPRATPANSRPRRPRSTGSYRNRHGHRRGPTVVLRDTLADRSNKPELIEGGWPQVVHQPADIRDGCLDITTQLGEERIGGRLVARHQLADSADLERLGGECRAGAVVQVAPKPATFLLARGDQSLSRPCRFSFERRISTARRTACAAPHLTGQILQQPPVGRIEGLAGSSPGQDQLADDLGSVDQRQIDEVPSPRAVFGCDGEPVVLPQGDSRVRQPERLSCCLDDSGKYRLGRKRLLHVPALERVLCRARRARHTSSRFTPRCNRSRRGPRPRRSGPSRAARAPCCLRCATGHRARRRSARRARRGSRERPVGRAVDDDVDIPQPVAQDRDADGHRRAGVWRCCRPCWPTGSPSGYSPGGTTARPGTAATRMRRSRGRKPPRRRRPTLSAGAGQRRKPCGSDRPAAIITPHPGEQKRTGEKRGPLPVGRRRTPARRIRASVARSGRAPASGPTKSRNARPGRGGRTGRWIPVRGTGRIRVDPTGDRPLLRHRS